MKARWISRKLTDRGYRLTPQRLMVVKAVEDAENHISAEEIYAQVSAYYPQMNISTVYRTLETLKAEGLVTETDMGDGRVRYHCMGKGHHHHLVCQKCGAVIDIEEAALDTLREAVRNRYGFDVDMKHLALFGRCARCRE
ncbi:MAG: transcriptional repressor [Chloroflexi bacterium]|nr:MAG: transcriptional repressor [Chloroflexota bacterium]